jgi:capsular exopolysaccharide synthesis family protein
MGFTVTPEQKLELMEYWLSVLKRKWAILGLGLVVAMVAAVFAYSLSPVYRTTATLLIETGKVQVVRIDEVYASNQQQSVQTQSEILRSREIAERTARALKLWEHPSFDPRQAKPGWRGQLKQMLGMAEPAKTVWTQQELEEATEGALVGRLAVDPVRNSQLVRVSFESEDPVLAAKVVNTAIEQYIAADRESRFALSQQVGNFLQDRMAGLKKNLEASERALQEYREKRGIVSLGGSSQAITGKQLDGAMARLQEAKSKRLELESAYQQVRAASPKDFADIPVVKRDPVVAETLKQITGAQRALLVLQETFSDEHYRVQQAKGEIDQLRKLLDRQSEQVVASLRREYEGARATEQLMEQSMGAATGSVQAVNREEFQLGVLERDAASNRQLYELFMSRAKETNLTGDVQAEVARIIDRAVPNFTPVRPDKTQIVIRALLLALVAGALASILVDRLDNTIKGGDDAEVRLRLPVLTALPMVADSERAHMARLFVDDSRSHYAEGIRTARTGVLLSSLDVPHKILLVTSTLPGEGKTTVAVNLAMAHAQTKRTLLIDADMRRAQAGKALGLAPGHKGLSNLVAGDAAPEQCMVILKDTKLYVMPVGDLPPNPLELLLSQRFKDALQQLSEHFEMIIIDSPPVELVSEALVLAPMATSVAFVVKAMSTPAPLARKSITRIQRAGGNILGVVVNQLDFKHAQRYYGEYGASGYSYGSYGPYGTYGNTGAEAPAAAVQGTKARIRMKAGLPE